MGNKQQNVSRDSMEADSQKLNETETESITSENVTVSPLIVSEINEFGPADLDDAHIFQFFNHRPVKSTRLRTQYTMYDTWLLDYDCAMANVYVSESDMKGGGNGLKSCRGYEKDEKVCEYWGECIVTKYTDEELDDNDTLDNEVFNGLMHRAIKTIAQPFSSKGIYLYIVGSLSCAGSYMNDRNYGADNMTKLLENNCTIIEKAHADFDPITGTFKTLNGIFEWLDKNPISIYARTVIPNASLEFYLDYEQRVLCKKRKRSTEEDDSEWLPSHASKSRRH